MQAKSAMTAKEKLEKIGSEKVEKLTKQNMEREQQLTALLQETETRHSKKPNVIFLLFPMRQKRGDLLFNKFWISFPPGYRLLYL